MTSNHDCFIFEPVDDFWATIRLTKPGHEKPSHLDLQFRVLSRKALKSWIDDFANPPEGSSVEDLLAEVIVNWKVMTNDHQSVPFSEEKLRELLDAYPASIGEIARQFIEKSTESRLGN
ncbi:MAG TPA: hypothetical protein PKY22_02360 [Accumulibacter sp.]|nr:hypothetical protein [Accumulibacter sp.]